jgi:hypothetical protein
MDGHRALRDEVRRKASPFIPTSRFAQRSPREIGQPSSEEAQAPLGTRSVQGEALEMPFEDTILMVEAKKLVG